MNWYKISQFNALKIPKIPVHGVFYHGSKYFPETGEFNMLNSDRSDWGAIWVCPEEYVAEEFSKGWCQDNGIQVVFQVDVNLKNVASIRSYEIETWEELMDYMGYSDIRELIPYLKQNGYDGWITKGSMGSMAYSDIAIFSSKIDIKMAKMKLNSQWTTYMSLRELNNKLRDI